MTVTAVFPGTFDPIHYGHIDIANRGAAIFEKLIIAVYDRPLKNLLFSPEERLKLVRASFQERPNIDVVPYSGLTVNFVEQVGAQVILRGLRAFSDFAHEFRMALANHPLPPAFAALPPVTRQHHPPPTPPTVPKHTSSSLP